MKKLMFISVLRGLAIIMVVMVHSIQFGSSGSLINLHILSIINSGARGVQLFYMLSAITLFYSFNQRALNYGFSKKEFFIRRFFRIAPLYYIAIIFYLWLNGTGSRYWLGDQDTITIWNIISNFLFIHSLSPYWITSIIDGGCTVSVEFLFYFLLPILFLRIKTLNNAIAFLLLTFLIRSVLFIALKNLHIANPPYLWDGFLYNYLPNQLPIFAMGIAMYFIIFKNDRYVDHRYIYSIAILVFLEAVTRQTYFLNNMTIYGFSFCLLIFSLVKYQPLILFNKIIVYTGNISYSIYLSHFAVIYFIKKFNIFDFIVNPTYLTAHLNYLINFLLVFSISVCIASICYFMIERPMIKFGKNLILRLRETQQRIY